MGCVGSKDKKKKGPPPKAGENKVGGAAPPNTAHQNSGVAGAGAAPKLATKLSEEQYV